MAKVGIVTDSTSSLPPDLIKEYDIRVTPSNVVIEGKSYRAGVDITPSEFYKIYKIAKKLPTSQSPAIGDTVDIFKKLAETTDSIVYIHNSTGLTTANRESALNAKDIVKKEVPGVNIELVDSRTSVGGQGLIALEAARAAKEGKELNQVVEVAKDMITRAHWIGMLETLRYLIKGGRAPKVSGWIGEILSVKPIIGMSGDTGVVQAIGRARTKDKAMTHLVELAKERLGEKKPVHMLIQYAELIEDGEKLREMVASQLDCAELYLAELSPEACVHSGPLLILAFHT